MDSANFLLRQQDSMQCDWDSSAKKTRQEFGKIWAGKLETGTSLRTLS